MRLRGGFGALVLLVAAVLALSFTLSTPLAFALPGAPPPGPAPAANPPRPWRLRLGMVGSDGAAPTPVRFPDLSRDAPLPPPAPPPAPAPVRPPASPEGLRLWSDGDSVSYFMTTNLFAILSQRGAIPVRGADYKISSRLTAATGDSAVLHVDFSDWFSYAADEMARYDPDLVVLMVGTNDAAFVDPAVFGADAGRMMDLLRRDGRRVAWVGLPAFVRPDLAARAPLLNAAAREAAASRGWVVFVDTSGIAPDGADGVHFSPGQGRLLAEAVVRALFPALAP